MKKNSFLETIMLAGTIIGAGIFSLPYIFSKIGLVPGLILLIVFSLVYSLIHLMYVRILEKEDADHQFFYLSHKYFPKFWANFSSLVIIGDLVFILLVYLTLAPSFAFFLWPAPAWLLAVIFWLASSIFIFVRPKIMALGDLLGIVCLISIIFLIFFIGRGQTLTVDWLPEINPGLFLLAFAPLLFSLAGGRAALHKIIEIKRQEKIISGSQPPLKSVIFWGSVLPSLIYIFFIVSVLRLQSLPTEDVFSGFSFLSPWVLFALGLMGLVSLWDSYFVIGTNLKDLLIMDLRLPRWLVFFLVLFLPLILYFSGLQSFLLVLGLAGGIFSALEGVFIALMWHQAFPKHRWSWVIWPLCLIFVMAIIYEVYTIFQ